MTISRGVIFFVGFTLIAAVVSALILRHRQAPSADWQVACDGASQGMGPDAPWQYVALFSYGCAAVAPITDRDRRVQFALDYGYPSLLVRDIGEAETAQIVTAVIAEGDRGFFAADPGVAAMVAAWPDDLRPPATVAFLSTLPGQPPAPRPFDVSMVEAAPLWHDGRFAPQIVDFCAESGCQDLPQPCNGPVSPAAKARIAQSAAALSTVQTSCPPSFEWLLALRRAGLVDTLCSSTFQINRVMQGHQALDAPCYDAQSGIGASPVASPADTLRFLREMRGTRPDAATEKVIAEYFPEIAAYLARE